jgi:signal transduction histidine kinase
MKTVSEEGRNTLGGLRASANDDVRSLESALSSIPRELSLSAKTDYRVVVQGAAKPVHRIVRDEIFSIGREAVVNAARHANAGCIEVDLEYAPAKLILSVRDNGCGIDPNVLTLGKDGHWGLQGMRERAEIIGGELRLFSRVGSGTEVTFTVPGKIAYERPRRKVWRRWMTSAYSLAAGTKDSRENMTSQHGDRT